MLLTITTTHQPATDLGYLLHKNPVRIQSFALGFGTAHVFYPEASEERCTATLLLDIDPVGLVRGRRGSSGSDGPLAQYVNDRPYVASSFLSVAIGQVYGSALAGRSRERPELAEMPIPLAVQLDVVPCRGGADLLRRLFEPLGYVVAAAQHPLDETVPAWGGSRYYTVDLSGTVRLRDLLAHLTVLIPVLDDEKHYWVGDDEVEKLLRRGAGWLAGHPERDLIADRYLKHKRRLTSVALARLTAEEPEAEDAEAELDREEEAIERPVGLGQQRIGAVLAALRASGTRRVLDLGCGEGRLLEALLREPAFHEIAGMDVSHQALEIARERLRLDRMPEQQRVRIALFQGSLTYRDKRLAGYDAAAVVEVIEHLDPHRLATFERVLFEFARPGTVVMTTPNAEYNTRFDGLAAGRMRHRDHRFEWTRGEFQAWAEQVCARFGYSVRFLPVGAEDPELGAPTQMAVFAIDGARAVAAIEERREAVGLRQGAGDGDHD